MQQVLMYATCNGFEQEYSGAPEKKKNFPQNSDQQEIFP